MSLTGRKACLPGNDRFREKMERCIVLLGMANEIILQNTFDLKTRELYKTVFENRRLAEASLTNGHPMSIQPFHTLRICYFSHLVVI